MTAVSIRAFEEDRDLAGVRRCLIELQDCERAIDRRMPPGAQIAHEYVARMMDRCVEHDGAIFVADADGEIVGYVTVLARIQNEELEDGDYEYALVADLVVIEAFRKRGLGRQLLARAEAYAREKRAEWLRVGVLTNNQPAFRLYESAGFSDRLSELEKPLAR